LYGRDFEGEETRLENDELGNWELGIGELGMVGRKYLMLLA
jgi:hypothetical protein